MFRCYYCITYGAGKTSSPIVGPVAGRPAASSPRLGPRSSLQLKRLGEYCTPQRTIPSVCYATVQQLGLVQKGWGGLRFRKRNLKGFGNSGPQRRIQGSSVVQYVIFLELYYTIIQCSGPTNLDRALAACRARARRHQKSVISRLTPVNK